MKIIVFTGIVLFAAALSYFWMIMPRMGKKPDMEPLKKWYYAHRGLHDNAAGVPENSMPAFVRAVESGFGIELDIQLSRDRIPVVFHDFTLERACRVKGKVCDHDFEELRRMRLFDSEETIPKFEDVLRMVAGRVPLIVELKLERLDVSLCPIADSMLHAYEGPYCVESFHPLGLLWYRRHHREVCRGQLSDAFLRESTYGPLSGLLYFFLQNLLFNFLCKPDFVAYNRKYPHILSRRICRGFYKNTAAAWTIRSREELEQARKYFDIFIFEGFLPVGRPGQDMTGLQQKRM